MADDVNANIRIDIDTSDALASLRALQSQISNFNKSVIQSNAAAVAAQKSMTATLLAQIGATKQFSTSMVNVETSTARLGKAIDKNRLSLGEYFRYGVASSKSFGRVFGREHTAIMDLATDRVKRLQTQYIAMGEAQNGVTRAMAVRPMHLFNADAAIGIQRQQLFNKLLNDGSTSLINFGKNTQWAGRQLMVGFTVPLTIFGGVAGQIFMDLERQVVNFRRVYGDAMTPAGETDQMVAEVQNLAKEFTKYGIAVKDTVGLAGDVAAAGAQGDDLIAATAQSTRLATLGMIEMDQAMTATMALQTAFRLSNEELAQSVDFLNAVENQTVLSLDDVTEAIPRVAPVIKGLGGDVQDLAIFLTAMREGGVSAAEGANALKSGLASLINPTKAAKEQLKAVGININAILSQNKGDIRAIVTEFGAALGTLDKFQRQQTLAKVFGKYQFARLGALFENISRDGSQAQRVVDLTGQSFEELGDLAEKELSAIEESVGMKFTGAVERLKLAIAPIGEVFLRVATPIIDVVSNLLDKFNELSPGVKQFITVLVAGVGVVVPTVIMLIGLFGNFIGQAIKGFAIFNNFFNKLRGGGKDLGYLANEELDAAAAAASLEGKTESLTSALNVQRSAVNNLSRAYANYSTSARAAATQLPQGFRAVRGMATGGMVGGTGNKDTEPALLTPGEFVINADASKKFAPLLAAINEGRIGKYAQGRTPINVGGRSFDVNVASQQQARALEERLNRAFSMGIEQFESLSRIVDDLGDTLIKSISQVDEKIKGAGLSEVLPKSAREQRYSYPGSESIPESLSRVGRPAQEIEREVRTANISAQGAVKAVEDNADLLRSLGYAEENLSVEAGIARSHMMEVDKSVTGLAAWEPDFWIAQSQAENQFIQTIKDSPRNQQMVESYLAQQLDSAEEASQLIAKIKTGVGLTEDEFQMLDRGLVALLDDVKSSTARAAEIRAATSPKFIKGAIATSGAAAARRGAGVSYDVGRISGTQAISGLKDGTDSHSESRAAQRVANDVVDGFVNQMERRSTEANRAGEILGEKTTSGVKSGTSDIRKILKEQLGVGPIVEQEQKNLRETIALRKEENREILKRAQLLARQGYGPDVARRLAAEQVASEKAAARAAAAAPPVVPTGAKMLPIVSADKAQKAVDQMASQTAGAGKEMGRVRGMASKFGGALRGGSMKVTGAMFALDGLVFGLSMMDNSIGEMAQKIMPVVFGLQGLQMILPMLMNPMGLLIAAVATLGVGIWFLNKKTQEAAKRVQDFAINSEGSAKALKEFSEGLGKIDPQAQWAKTVAGVTKKNEEAFGKATEFVKSESGQQMVSRAKSLSGQGRVDAMLSELNMAIATQLIDKDTARSIAQALSVELKDPALGQALVRGITDFGQRTGDNYLRQQKETIDSINNSLDIQILKYEEEAAIQQRINELKLAQYEGRDFDQNELLDLQLQVDNAEDMSYSLETIAKVTGNVLNASTKLSQIQASLNIQYQQGSINLKEYRLLSDEVSQSQKNIADQIANIQKNSSDDTFRSQMLNAATALGMTTEELDAATTQIDALQKAMETVGFAKGAENQAREIQKITDSILSGMLTRELDTGQVGGMLDILTSGKQEYQVYVDLVQKNPTQAASILEAVLTLEKLPPQFKTSVDLDPEKFISSVGEIQVASSYFLNDSIRNGQAFAAIMNGVFSTEQVSSAQEFYESIEGGIKNIDGAVSSLDLENIVELDKFFSDNKKLKKDASITITGTSGPITTDIGSLLDSANVKWKEFDALPNINKQIVITALMNLEQLRQQMATVAAGFEGVAFGGGGELGGLGMMFSDALNAVDEAMNIKPTGGVGDTTKTGGSGSKSESWLQGLIKEIEATLQLVPKEMNKLKRIAPDMPQEFINLIGFGEEGLARMKELLGLSKKEINNLVNKWIKSTTSETVQGIQGEIAMAEQEQNAISILLQQGVGKEDAEKIASNSANALLIVSASAGKTKKSLAGVIEMFKEWLAATESSDPNAKRIEDIENQIELETIAFERSMKHLDDLIEAEQEKIDLIQEEIDGIEELNAADERLLRDKDRQIEAYNRQIDGVERLIEKEQARIDKLKEEDDLRNRRSSALSHELELLSQAEQEIRDVYQDRLYALDKVAEINERILQQQRDQLNISQALASGDIYEATRAAQEMRQNDAAFAQRQVREALTTGMENEIAGLRTSEGLTREQAEKEIASIKEQSYQTSLLIQGIEDTILIKNKEIEAIKINIRNVEDEKLVIEDRIYDRETLILDIQNKRLKPAQQQYESLVDQRDEAKKIFDTKIETMKKDVEDLKLGAAKLEQVNRLVEAWTNVRNAIAEANKVRDEGIKKLGAVPVRVEGQSYDEWQASIAKWESDRAALESTYNTSVSKAYASGDAAMTSSAGSSTSLSNVAQAGYNYITQGAFAGGMIKKYYGGGNVLGSGARDSVSAMLSPGEFVVRKAMVDKYGTPLFDSINQGSFAMPKYNMGQTTTGNVSVKTENTSNIVAPMYNNYSVNVSVSNTNASADEIANRTIMKIKQMQGTQIRSGRGY